MSDPSGFTASLAAAHLMLAEGAVIENLRRDAAVRLDPHVANAALVYGSGSEVMAGLYRRYLAIGREHRLPMVVETPTWRANPDRVRAAGLEGRDVNADCFRFLARLRAEQGSYADRVFIAGLMGCARDAYRPEEALSEAEAASFHRAQAGALAGAGADLLLAATLPALSEALGLARALAGTGLPYVLSFVLLPEGTLLDGTPLADAVRDIDARVRPAPLCYMANCVHPDRFQAALDAARAGEPAIVTRVVGLQANTSRRPPGELDGLGHLEDEPPELFARAMLGVHDRLGTKLLGGCCGTGPGHIEAVARHWRARLSERNEVQP